MATSFSGGRSWSTGENHNHGQATGKLYHLRLRVECTLFCHIQSRARTHTILVTGLYELLGNPTTKLIEPHGPFPLPLSNRKYNIIKEKNRSQAMSEIYCTLLQHVMNYVFHPAQYLSTENDKYNTNI